MKIKAQKQIIESILINLQPFLEKKDASQITSHVLFKTEDNKCVIKATDSEIGLKIVTDHITVEHEGSFTAHGKKLLDIVRILKDDEITLELLNDTLVIKQKQSKFKLPTFDPDLYPTFPIINDKPQISLDSLSLIKNLKKISPAIDTNNPKFELNGALINIKNDSTDLVGTDTRRLAIATIDSSNSEALSLIVPKKAILEIQKLFLDQINIFFDETNLIITNDNYFFYTRLINGKFPDYERIIPSSVKHSITLPKKEMVEAIKMITTISQEIKMTFLSDTIIFNSLSADNVEAKTEIALETGLADKFELSLNSRYLLDFISQIDSNEFFIQFNEPSLPFVVKDENFITIIMPIVA
ncbi:DNA polymerase III subunit beta [Sulfurovum sp. zt1-1]|uniref:Beta sliding clamp n=1 Tax=Sulfurovum zhangzhouensis TaxID=3019067 RepID=A0ABT7R1A7_9BACT|nr:DNA polymerase III subunit beta [Sulfurovum zhangzhouensis]MDM5272589.1 DNA polymerase III subunit beta [Sulfurovum zhangzhouensis]